jgi:hypothetical protein
VLAGFERVHYDVDVDQIADEPKHAGRKNGD